jgi:regulator of RNase E activity RraB
MFIATFPSCASTNACCDEDAAADGGGLSTCCAIVYDTVADIRAITELTQDRMVLSKGQTIPYDTMGHFYIYEADEMSADNDIDYIKPATIAANQPGRWRIYI